MYYKLTSDELDKVNKASKITSTDYDLKGDFIPVEKLASIMEDLLHELDVLQEKYEDLEKDLEDNYKPISYAEQIGYNERDFY